MQTKKSSFKKVIAQSGRDYWSQVLQQEQLRELIPAEHHEELIVAALKTHPEGKPLNATDVKQTIIGFTNISQRHKNIPLHIRRIQPVLDIKKRAKHYSQVTDDAVQWTTHQVIDLTAKNPKAKHNREQHFTEPWALFDLREQVLARDPAAFKRTDNVVIDIGCGDGRLAATLLEGFNQEVVIGMDIDLGLLAHAKKDWAALDTLKEFQVCQRITNAVVYMEATLIIMNPPWGNGDTLFWEFMRYALSTFKLGGSNCRMLVAYPDRLQDEVSSFFSVNDEWDIPTFTQVLQTGRQNRVPTVCKVHWALLGSHQGMLNEPGGYYDSSSESDDGQVQQQPPQVPPQVPPQLPAQRPPQNQRPNVAPYQLPPYQLSARLQAMFQRLPQPLLGPLYPNLDQQPLNPANQQAPSGVLEATVEAGFAMVREVGRNLSIVIQRQNGVDLTQAYGLLSSVGITTRAKSELFAQWEIIDATMAIACQLQDANPSFLMALMKQNKDVMVRLSQSTAWAAVQVVYCHLRGISLDYISFQQDLAFQVARMQPLQNQQNPNDVTGTTLSQTNLNEQQINTFAIQEESKDQPEKKSKPKKKKKVYEEDILSDSYQPKSSSSSSDDEDDNYYPSKAEQIAQQRAQRKEQYNRISQFTFQANKQNSANQQHALNNLSHSDPNNSDKGGAPLQIVSSSDPIILQKLKENELEIETLKQMENLNAATIDNVMKAHNLLREEFQTQSQLVADLISEQTKLQLSNQQQLTEVQSNRIANQTQITEVMVHYETNKHLVSQIKQKTEELESQMQKTSKEAIVNSQEANAPLKQLRALKDARAQIDEVVLKQNERLKQIEEWSKQFTTNFDNQRASLLDNQSKLQAEQTKLLASANSSNTLVVELNNKILTLESQNKNVAEQIQTANAQSLSQQSILLNIQKWKSEFQVTSKKFISIEELSTRLNSFATLQFVNSAIQTTINSQTETIKSEILDSAKKIHTSVQTRLDTEAKSTKAEILVVNQRIDQIQTLIIREERIIQIENSLRSNQKFHLEQIQDVQKQVLSLQELNSSYSENTTKEVKQSWYSGLITTLQRSKSQPIEEMDSQLLAAQNQKLQSEIDSNASQTKELSERVDRIATSAKNISQNLYGKESMLETFQQEQTLQKNKMEVLQNSYNSLTENVKKLLTYTNNLNKDLKNLEIVINKNGELVQEGFKSDRSELIKVQAELKQVTTQHTTICQQLTVEFTNIYTNINGMADSIKKGNLGTDTNLALSVIQELMKKQTNSVVYNYNNSNNTVDSSYRPTMQQDYSVQIGSYQQDNSTRIDNSVSNQNNQLDQSLQYNYSANQYTQNYSLPNTHNVQYHSNLSLDQPHQECIQYNQDNRDPPSNPTPITQMQAQLSVIKNEIADESMEEVKSKQEFKKKKFQEKISIIIGPNMQVEKDAVPGQHLKQHQYQHGTPTRDQVSGLNIIGEEIDFSVQTIVVNEDQLTHYFKALKAAKSHRKITHNTERWISQLVQSVKKGEQQEDIAQQMSNLMSNSSSDNLQHHYQKLIKLALSSTHPNPEFVTTLNLAADCIRYFEKMNNSYICLDALDHTLRIPPKTLPNIDMQQLIDYYRGLATNQEQILQLISSILSPSPITLIKPGSAALSQALIIAHKSLALWQMQGQANQKQLEDFETKSIATSAASTVCTTQTLNLEFDDGEIKKVTNHESIIAVLEILLKKEASAEHFQWLASETHRGLQIMLQAKSIGYIYSSSMTKAMKLTIIHKQLTSGATTVTSQQGPLFWGDRAFHDVKYHPPNMIRDQPFRQLNPLQHYEQFWKNAGAGDNFSVSSSKRN